MTKRVLVVDDELDTLNLLKTIIEIHGFEAITTLNSVDAILLAETEKADIALLDVMMPKLDGFSLCKMMRAYPFTANLPIIFVTAYTALDLEDRRREAGADHVLQKPIDMKKLVSLIEGASTLRPTASVSRGKTGMLDESALEALPKRKTSQPPTLISDSKPPTPPADGAKEAILPPKDPPSKS